MTTITHSPTAAPQPGWFSRAEAWLDSKGKGAWIGAMVLSFILFWPVGLALLFYMIWSKRIFAHSCRQSWKGHTSMKAYRPSGNTAFDAYKADTLKRLEEEQERFEAFLERLRDAKDKAEFDQFMDEAGSKSEARTSETLSLIHI